MAAKKRLALVFIFPLPLNIILIEKNILDRKSTKYIFHYGCLMPFCFLYKREINSDR
ncbi:hypothetical protein KL86DES1_21110 [uncultured Desulfovibrio sp.]|uniref:Uncharacterized protein n=1 Tax=uncultured Desulfovibrio sp. TaxID=167968 RepID=A0A212L6I4_9BACT|nr:hypothetical protein KL86DES1_21110 [uncultured Desulfovibrio sp.]VZH34008.1 conserved protein of unknown function [Desulfovibrio sp. 86]